MYICTLIYINRRTSTIPRRSKPPRSKSLRSKSPHSDQAETLPKYILEDSKTISFFHKICQKYFEKVRVKIPLVRIFLEQAPGLFCEAEGRVYPVSVQSSTRPKAEENFARASESNADEAEGRRSISFRSYDYGHSLG